MMYLLNLSYLVLKHKTDLEFTISSGKLFHFLIVLTQKEFILNVFRALGYLFLLFSVVLKKISKS